MNNNFAVKLKNLTLAYNRQPAIHHINGEFLQGELTAITGPNGAGKSTLLKAIAGILPVFEGDIEFGEISGHFLTYKNIAYMPQAADTQRDFPINILQMVCSGFWQQTGAFGQINKTKHEKAKYALEEVGLKGFENRNLDSISAGQFQRALFARVIVQDAKLILLDEPFTAVDNSTTNALLKIVKNWHNEGRTVICVLHDFEQIKENFTDCLLLARKIIAWGKPSEVLRSEHLFGARFFREAPPATSEVCES
ncbi:MAG: ABC transporter ATP-binding protein [Rickettsiales bacterium]|jgi:zinc/manganese transport system ATP-binding protein